MGVTPIRKTTPDAQQPGSWDHLIEPGRVHRSLYTDAAIFAAEMRHIFAGTWVFLGHASEVPESNSYVLKQLGNRPLILTRDGEGQVHALFNRCTHRGAYVCREQAGRARFFTCGYHGWTFGNDGRALDIPLADAYGDQHDLGQRDLPVVPFVANYRGFLFGTLNPARAAQPIEEHLAGARQRLDEWIDHNGGDSDAILVSGAQRFTVNANWKAIYDNAGDGYHPEYSHQSLLRMTHERYGKNRDIDYFGGSIDDTPMYSQDVGNGHTFLDQRPCMYAESAFERQRPQPGREYLADRIRAEAGQEKGNQLLEMATGAGMNINIFPNLLLVGNQIQVLDPLRVNETRMTWYATRIKGAPDAVNTLRLRTQEDFPMFGEVDDTANFESCQDGMVNADVEWIDISRHLHTGLTRQQDGYPTEPISSDLHMRSYYRQWRKLMSEPVALQLQRGGEAAHS